MSRSGNSGVEATLGFTLQRNTALYLLLENYTLNFQNEKYFICLEHHDDFLFCFLDEYENAKKIETYQSKKKSTKEWTLDAVLIDYIKKILETGKGILADEIIKSDDYSHFLYFITNQNIFLESDCLPKKNRKNITVKEDKSLVSYLELPDEIKQKLKNKIESSLHDELSNFNFYWHGLSRIESIQNESLIGKSVILFGNTINDHKSAIDTLFLLFFKIENILNQNGEIKLLDKTKRVSSDEVEKAFKLITTKGKAFEYWKNHETEISQTLKIKPSEKEKFKLDFETAFDFFKSIESAEHEKIFEFVKMNYNDCEDYSEHQTVLKLYDLFIVEQKSNLFKGNQLKAILYAAYFEILNIKPL